MSEKIASKVVFAILTKKRPISEEIIGYRMVLAVFNRARITPDGEREQSFSPAYLLAESGDYTTPPGEDTMFNWLDTKLEWLGNPELHVK